MFKFLKRFSSIDNEYRELIQSHIKVKTDATQIRDYLLMILSDNQNDSEKFSDLRLSQAAALLENIGPGAFYWMSDIASQMVLLSAAKFNDIPTSVDASISAPVTPEQIVNAVVRV